MTPMERSVATLRLQRALLEFRNAQSFLLATERKLKSLPTEEVEAFWARSSRRIEEHVALAAKQVVQAFTAFSASGQVAAAEDRHLVTEAKRVLAETKP